MKPSRAAAGSEPPHPSESAAAAAGLRPPRLRRLARQTGRAGTAELVRRLVRDLPGLVGLLIRLTRDPRVSRLDKLLLAGAVGYLVFPNDLIPDWIPVAGQLDDLVIVGVSIHRLLDRAGPDLLLEHWRGDPYTLELLLDGLTRVRER